MRDSDVQREIERMEKNMSMKMKLYYVAYDYGHGEVECIDGPFVTHLDASDAQMELLHSGDDPKLIVVSYVHYVDVE